MKAEESAEQQKAASRWEAGRSLPQGTLTTAYFTIMTKREDWRGSPIRYATGRSSDYTYIRKMSMESGMYALLPWMRENPFFQGVMAIIDFALEIIGDKVSAIGLMIAGVVMAVIDLVTWIRSLFA